MRNEMTINQPLENAHLYLFTMTYELILDKRLTHGDNKIDVSSLPAGLYTYRILDKDSRVFMRLF